MCIRDRDYTDQMLAYAAETDYDKPKPGLAGSWRNRLADQDIRMIETRAGDRLTNLGFEPSGLPPMTISSRRATWLLWHNRIGKLRARARVASWFLVVADLVARASKRESWQRAVRLKLNEAEKAHLKKSWSDNSDTRTSH